MSVHEPGYQAVSCRELPGPWLFITYGFFELRVESKNQLMLKEFKKLFKITALESVHTCYQNCNVFTLLEYARCSRWLGTQH